MAADTHSTHGTTETTEHETGGLPQFQFQYWGGQIVWLLIIFAVLYVLLAKVFTPKLRGVIDERAKTIADAVEAARLAQAEAQASAEAAQAELASARASAHRTASEAAAKAKAEAAARQAAEDAKLSEKMAEAERRIRETRDAAMANVSAIVADTTAAIVDKLTGRAASPAELSAALAGRET